MKVGRRLALKVLNASKFVLGLGASGDVSRGDPNRRTGRSWSPWGRWSARPRSAFEAYDYSAALEVTERFFWQFCDDYLELVKERAYGAQGAEGAASARATLGLALDVLLRLLAPIMPFVTEEVWSWWRDGSIHTTSWPDPAELAITGDPALLDDLAAALIAIRGAKSQAKVSMKTEVSAAAFAGPPGSIERLRDIEADLRAVGRLVGDVTWTLDRLSADGRGDPDHAVRPGSTSRLDRARPLIRSAAA